MSIDRIGKGPGGPPGVTTPDAAGVKGSTTERASSTGATFEVGGTKAASATGATNEISPADQVRSGEISLDAYLDQRVSEATKHLDGKLPSEDLADIQRLLRSQLASDPTLVEMVRAATGATPVASDE